MTKCNFILPANSRWGFHFQYRRFPSPPANTFWGFLEGQTKMPSAESQKCFSTNGIFRRAQSLRFPRSSVQHSTACTPPPCTSPIPSSSFSGRNGSRAYRSKSSRQRFGSLEAQSLLGRMSAGQRAALLSSWRQMRHQLGPLMRKILLELEQQEPAVKEIFYKAGLVDCFTSASSAGGGGSVAANMATMDEHVRLMTKFFEELVAFVEAAGPSGNDGGEEITAMIKRLGQQHAILAHSSGLSAEVWEKLGEIAMEKICTVEAVQKTREAGRAWRTLVAFLTDKIRCGFEGEARAFSRRPSMEQQLGSVGATNTTIVAGGDMEDEGGGHQCKALGWRLQQLRTECGWKEDGGVGDSSLTNGKV